MAILVGQPVRLTYPVVDANGAATTPATASLVITRPDQTSTSPITVTPASPTTYDYVTTQVGRHVAVWTTTGPTTTGSDVFNVASATSAAMLVGLADAKAALNMTSTRNDEELRRMIVSASQQVEAETQLWHRTTVTETLPAASAILLGSRPIVSVTSVTQGGVLASTGFEVRDGLLVASTGYRPWSYYATAGQVTVVYEAGTAIVPEVVQDAVLTVVADMWETQRGAAGLPLSPGASEDLLRPVSTGLPPRAAKLLEPWLKLPGVA